MWIWLTISMLLVIACSIFGIYSFMRSRTLQRTISAELGLKSRNVPARELKNNPQFFTKQAMLNLETRLKLMEENSLLNAHHLQEIQKKLAVLESGNSINRVSEEEGWEDSGEDWEKLFYETRREKRSLEDSFNATKTSLEESLTKLKELEKQQAGQAAVRSDAESRISEINSLQNIIEELQLRLEGSKERESELAQEVVHEKSKYVSYELMQKENNRLRSEKDILESRFNEINARNNLLEQKIRNLTELGSILEISEYEKMGIKNSVKQLLQKM